MAITLARICANAEKTYGMKLIAGRAGMDNFVRWVHIVEDSEVPDFMHGNELVFTTGIGHKGSGWLLDFVRQLKGKNAAGVVVRTVHKRRSEGRHGILRVQCAPAVRGAVVGEAH